MLFRMLSFGSRLNGAMLPECQRFQAAERAYREAMPFKAEQTP